MFFILSNFLIATINATNKATATTVTNINSKNNLFLSTSRQHYINYVIECQDMSNKFS